MAVLYARSEWLRIVVRALEQIGRPAHLREIYEAVAEIVQKERPDRIPGKLMQTIQSAIYQHSSDSTKFRAGYPDVFKQEPCRRSRSGEWGLRKDYRRWFVEGEEIEL